MKKTKIVPIMAALSFAFILCLSVSMTAFTAFAAAGDTYCVPDANGWNQHFQTGGNPFGGCEVSAGKDGFTTVAKFEAPMSQSFCNPIDLTKPFIFEYKQDKASHRLLFGLGASYRDCFATTKEVKACGNSATASTGGVVNQAGNLMNLNENTYDCNELEFAFAFASGTGGIGGGNVFAGSSVDTPEAWAFTGFSVVPSRPAYGLGDLVSMEIYIGSGENGDQSYLKLSVNGNSEGITNPTLSVTRSDFVKQNVLNEKGETVNNDGTVGYFGIINTLMGTQLTERISLGKEITVVKDDGFTVDIPKYGFQYYNVEFTVSGEKKSQVTLVKSDNSEETLLPDDNGVYSFVMPKNGIKNIKVAEAAFEVTFKDGETVLSTVNAKEGATVSAPATPVKKGYVFEGWYTDVNLTNKYDFNSAVTSDMSLYAKWLNGVTVTFADSDDDSEISYVSILSGGKVSSAAAPEKEGAKFAGWYYDKLGEKPFDANKTYTEDTVVYALWGYTVTWQVRGFDAVTSTAVKNGKLAEISMNTALKGFAIDTAEITWYTDAAYTQPYDFNGAVTADTRLYGKITDGLDVPYAKPDRNGWDNNTGIQKDNSGNDIAGQQYGAVGGIESDNSGYSLFVLNNAGMIINTFALDVTKTIYLDYSFRIIDNFKEWMTFSITDTLSGSYLSGGPDSATNNRGTLTTFIHDAAPQNGSASARLQANKNCSLAAGITDLSTANYKFAPDKTDKISQFKPYMNTLKVVIGLEKGTSYIELNGTRILNLNCVQSDFANGTAYFTLGSFRSTVVCTRLYQNFTVTAEASDSAFADNVSVNVSAADFGDEVTLTFDCTKNDNKYRVAKLKIGDEEITNPKLTETQDGKFTYTFNMPFENTAVKAYFEEFAYVINFNNGYSTDLHDTQSVKPGEKAVKPADPERNGWTFAGWYTDVECTDAFDFSVAPTADIELYAKWEKRVYTCTLMSDGKVYDTLTVTGLNQKFKEPVEPTRKGYVFDGWYTDSEFKNVYSFNKVVTDDVTLYAKWTPAGDESEKSGCGSGCGGNADAVFPIAAIALIAAGAVMIVLKSKRESK